MWMCFFSSCELDVSEYVHYSHSLTGLDSISQAQKIYVIISIFVCAARFSHCEFRTMSTIFGVSIDVREFTFYPKFCVRTQSTKLLS